jgi:pyruvate,water dikinase
MKGFLEHRGRGIAPGLACGPLRRNRPELTPREAQGSILLAERAVPDDVPRILAAAGTLTFAGAVLSHVSLLCREFGKVSVSFAGFTPARFTGEGEPGLLVIASQVLEEGDVVFLDGTRGRVTIPESRATARRVFAPLSAYAKLPEDGALLSALLEACPPGDGAAATFLLEAALAYRIVPAGLPARRLLAALASDPARAEDVATHLADLTARAMAQAAARCDEALETIQAVEDLDELQRAMRGLEGVLDAELKLLDDLDADPDRLEPRLEPVLAAAASRREILEARLREEVDAALALDDPSVRTRLGGLFRLLRRARGAAVSPGAVQRLHQRLSAELARERARAGVHLVLPLRTGTHGGRALVGGKAAALMDILAALPADVRVPRGFVVTSAAYRLHLLGETGEKLRLSLQDEDIAGVSRKARAALLGGEIPEEVVLAVREAYAPLAAGRLAVRSSATIEDGPIGTLAGLFDTYLGVAGLPDLLDRLRWAWASLWNSRALAALFAAGASPLRASQAVIVQEMIETRAAGVLFSRDPAGRPGTLLVNAAWGLGEGISQGEVAGDLFWVRRSDGEILAAETGTTKRRIELAPSGMGTVEVPLDASQAGRPCLDPGDLARLAALARTMEEVTGRAQDVEFGFDRAGGLVVFQTRRILPRRLE